MVFQLPGPRASWMMDIVKVTRELRFLGLPPRSLTSTESRVFRGATESRRSKSDSTSTTRGTYITMVSRGQKAAKLLNPSGALQTGFFQYIIEIPKPSLISAIAHHFGESFPIGSRTAAVASYLFSCCGQTDSILVRF